MTASTRSAVSMVTDCFAADDIEAAARQTGFVKRTAKITGKIFLALVPFGVWSEAKTTLAQLAAKVTQLGAPLEVSPEAMHQRMHKRAPAFLQEMIRSALATGHSRAKVCDDGLLTYCTKGYGVDSTGFGLPDRLKDLLPGAGGSAAKAGATMQAAWDYKSSVLGHCALTPWNLPENNYVDTVVAGAPKGVLFLCDLGYVNVQALARIAAAGADFLRRLNHQTNLYETVAGRLTPIDLVSFLHPVQGPIVEKDLFMGAKDQVGARLIACRVPEMRVHDRRRKARKNAKKKGDPPSHAHLTLGAWNLCITTVPCTIGKTDTVIKGYPLRWQIALIFKSWKSSLHFASIHTKNADSPGCYLSGRMRLMVLTYALCPQMRATLGLKKKRELSVLNLVRYFQALAEEWMHAIFQAEFALRRFLQQACATAERLVAKASRKRPTTAQILRESLRQHHASIAFAVAVNA